MKKRDSIPLSVRLAKGEAIKGRLFGLKEFGEARRVLFYASFRSEVATGEMIGEAINSGKEVLLPRVDTENRTLSAHVIRGMREVSPGYMGIPEPATGGCVEVEDIGLIVIPGVAFDARGWRIGYGGGYYDRLLQRVGKNRPLIALAFEEQIFESVPHDDRDIGMDMIITDRRIIRCDGQGKD